VVDDATPRQSPSVMVPTLVVKVFAQCYDPGLAVLEI
jgi:hypothetical protein